MPSTVVFGSYDLLYYTLPPSSGGSLKWLEDQHERRHDLDWNYERHPVCLYCPQGSYDRMLDTIDNNAHDGCPLVLTMARIAKHPLVSGDPQLDDMLAALQVAIDGKVVSLPDVRMVACWNLGNADFIILSRLRDLSSLRTPYLELGMEGLRFKDARQKEVHTRFTSFSSYCAFPAARDKNQNIRVSEKKLREWLEHDSDLQFVAFAEAMVGSKEIVDRYDHRRFLFGDRDYQLFGSLDDNQEQAESVMAVVGELLDPAKSATIQASSLIPSLALDQLPEVDTDALPKTYGLTWEEVEKPEAEVDILLQIEISKKHVPDRQCVGQMHIHSPFPGKRIPPRSAGEAYSVRLIIF